MQQLALAQAAEKLFLVYLVRTRFVPGVLAPNVQHVENYIEPRHGFERRHAMPSSKLFRKGRWVWACSWSNNASRWEDNEQCLACSQGSFSTKKEAENAAARHDQRTNHRPGLWLRETPKARVWQIK